MVKVLFAGDCSGRVEAMFKRVAAVNTANGPCDMLLCSGGFFIGGADDGEFGGELLPYITGEKQAPLPTYFIGGWGSGSKQALEALSASDSNIRYLGRSGVTQIGGLSVAFLDGTYNAPAFRAPETSATSSPGCRYYSENDVDRLKLALVRAEGDVDVLLTCEWPAGTCDGLPDAAKPQDVKKLDGSTVCAEVAMACRPRYHIAAGKHAFYARPPYINKDLGAGSHVTRFIALAGVGVSKQKWLHALALTPAAQMTPEQLTVIPEGSTPCPYEIASKKRAAQEAEKEEAGLGNQDWRWQQRGAKRQQLAPGERAPIAAPSLGRKDIVKDKSKTAFVSNVAFRATEDDIVDYFSQCGTVVDVVRRTHAQTGRLNAFCHVQFDSEEALQQAIQLNGQPFMGRPLFIDAASSGAAAVARSAKPVEGCWFCLSNPNADVELVASVGEECYVALDKGAITDQHCLMLPVEHFPCSLAAPTSTTEEMGRYLSALRTCFAAGGKELVGFERYMALRKSGGNHCHLNAIAVPAAAAAQARAAFERAAERHGFTLTFLPKLIGDAEAKEQLRGVVGDGEHFVALLPDGARMAHRIAYGERFPLNFGREVLAELAGCPERADWKACAVSKEEEGARLKGALSMAQAPSERRRLQSLSMISAVALALVLAAVTADAQVETCGIRNGGQGCSDPNACCSMRQYSLLWGQNGELWSPRSRLPDYSYIGYMANERAVPGESEYPSLFNVRNYGARGDGVADDTKAIQAAIKAASAAAARLPKPPIDNGFQNQGRAGVAVLLPAGRYRVTESIEITQSNVVLRGEGVDKTVLFLPKPLQAVYGNQMIGASSAWSYTGGFLICKGRKVTEQSSEYRLARVTAAARKGDRRLQVTNTGGMWVGRWVRLFAAQPLRSVVGRRLLRGPNGRDGLGDAATGRAARPEPGFVPLPDSLYEAGREAQLLGLDQPEDGGIDRDGDGVSDWVPAASADGTLDAYLYHENVVSSGSSPFSSPRIRFASRVTAVGPGWVELERPLLYNIVPEWEVSVYSFQASVQHSGFEGFTIEFQLGPYPSHHQALGYNGIFTSYCANSWVRNVRVINSDTGGETINGDFMTWTNITLDATAPRGTGQTQNRNGHHGLWAAASAYVLFTNITVRTEFIHDLTLDVWAQECAFTNVKGINTNLDMHRGGVHNNLWSNIELGRGTRPFASSGDSSRGAHAASNNTYWNIHVASGAALRLPECDFGPLLTFVGRLGPPLNDPGLGPVRAASVNANAAEGQHQRRHRHRAALRMHLPVATRAARLRQL
ncbi:Zinc finger CCCH domain-containing 64 [Micractinium conductrix]|uniref:Zinc finger CCCH domain-containing 64 n=1 Tax=Micractinium conductrix TaxID=554055 RepID=A0A2P6VQM4_9CHLO|nr:Zinc finger CCCH domain-containing 64 [Micractinium conductrix]|eukprot:PSC76403.1 Zinc finger CCCH domain-containing 64 [Micractinium conductrix]